MMNRIFVSVYDSWDTYCTGLRELMTEIKNDDMGKFKNDINY